MKQNTLWATAHINGVSGYLNIVCPTKKKENPSYKATGGYLKIIEPMKSPQKWWNGLYKVEKNIVMSLPNFDADIFKKITGIEVKKEKQ